MTRSRPIRGLALLTRGRDGRNLMVGASGGTLESLTQLCLAEVRSQGGSVQPEDWMAWALDRAPTPAILTDLEKRVTPRQGGGSHPAVVQAVFDARHPKLRAKRGA